MNEQRHSVIPAVWVIVTNQADEIFLLRRANTGWRDGWWTVPAGHVEKGEGPTAAAIRELKEEAGLTVDANQLSTPCVYFYPEDARINERVSLFFVLKSYTGTPANVEPNKASESGWFKRDELPEHIPPLLKRAFIDIADGTFYSERYYDEQHHKELLQ